MPHASPTPPLIWVVAEKADRASGSKKEVEGKQVSGHNSVSGMLMEESPDSSLGHFGGGSLAGRGSDGGGSSATREGQVFDAEV